MGKYRKRPHCQHQNTQPNLLVYPRNNQGHQPLLAVLEIWVIQTTKITFSILPYNTTQWPSLAHTNTLMCLELPCENNNRLETMSTKVWAAGASWQASLYQFTVKFTQSQCRPHCSLGNGELLDLSPRLLISCGDSMYVTSMKF